MKRTTYILLGVLILGALGIISSIAYIGTHGADKSPYEILIKGQAKTVSLHNSRKIVFEQECDSDLSILVNSKVEITQAKENEKASITYPEGWDEYLTVVPTDTAIIVKIKINKDSKDHDKWHYREFTSEKPIKIILPQMASVIANNISMELDINNYNAESLTVFSAHQVTFNQVNVTDLKIIGDGFQMKSGSAKNLYVNIGEGSWAVTPGKFAVDTEYLTGGTESTDLELNKGECNKIVYTPTDKESSMSIKINQPAVITMTK